MEDILKLSDEKIFNEREEDIKETVEENYYNEQNHTKIGDVIFVQFVICLLIVIALAVLNIFKPDLTNDILYNINNNIDRTFNYKEEISGIITKIMGNFNVQL